MSDQWEIVGRNKQKGNAQQSKKLSKNDRKKFIENAPRVEDILPLAQVKSLYNALDSNKENKKPTTKDIAKENESKKVAKKPVEKKKEVVKEKVPPPKNLEAAVKLVSVKDLTSEIKIGQARFEDAPLVWLKGLTGFLNTKLCVDHNPTFAGKPFEYPLNLFSGEVREILKQAIKDAGDSVVQPYYDWCLASMANDMTKATNLAVGYKVILQLLTFQKPSIAVANIPKVQLLMSSYQNRQVIGLSILWAVGLGGVKDMAVGLKAWQELMLPLIELRNYTSYVIGYLKDLFSQKTASKTILTGEQFIITFDALHSTKYNIPNASKQELTGISSLLQKYVLDLIQDKKLGNVFRDLLERLQPSTPDSIKSQLFSYIDACLEADPQNYNEWRKVYIKTLPQSAVLLRHIARSSNYSPKSKSSKHIKETLNAFLVTSKELLQEKNKNEGLTECHKNCLELKKKMSVTRSFPYTLGSMMLLAAMGAVLVYDCRRYGSFQSSSTGRFLRDIGALNYGEQAWSKAKYFSVKSYSWAEANVPVYYKSAVEHSKPYLQTGLDMGVGTLNHLSVWYENIRIYIEDSVPVVVAWINIYAPGLLEKMKTFIFDSWESVKYFTILAWQILLDYFILAGEWLKTNVFVGSLSPENLQKYSLEVLNTTQIYAVWTYDWVCQKVQTLSKIQ